MPEDTSFPPLIYANVSPRSVGGQSLFDARAAVDALTVRAYESEPSATDEAIRVLERAGFVVLAASPISLNIAGTRQQYEDFFATTLVLREVEALKPGQRLDTATLIDTADNDVPGFLDTSRSSLSEELEGGAIETPRYPMQNAVGPNPAYWHLDVPTGVANLLNAGPAHIAGVNGAGTRVVMVDTGWVAHPWFSANGYAGQVVLGPGASNPTQDADGHGTGESANIFSVAPAANFQMVKASFVNITAAFNTAAALQPRPDVISCSWGSSVQIGPLSPADQLLAAAVAAAVASGIIVVFSAGNGHYGFPGQHPDVISAGGVFVDQAGNRRASDYASGFASQIYRGRNVPDACGLVGTLPHAIYLMLPVPSGSTIDQDLSGQQFPNGDETGNSDGWAAFSGTSAAAPQLAGACALLRQVNPQISPVNARAVLTATAVDIIAGSSNPATGGNSASPGRDLATGAGLIDVSAAVASVGGHVDDSGESMLLLTGGAL